MADGIASIGPTLVPMQITSFADFTTILGSYTDNSYVPFVVNDYSELLETLLERYGEEHVNINEGTFTPSPGLVE